MKATRHLNRVGKHFRDSHESDLSERHQLYAIDLFENRIKADESLLTKQEIATFLNGRPKSGSTPKDTVQRPLARRLWPRNGSVNNLPYLKNGSSQVTDLEIVPTMKSMTFG
jgi:hypothetical protein